MTYMWEVLCSKLQLEVICTSTYLFDFDIIITLNMGTAITYMWEVLCPYCTANVLITVRGHMYIFDFDIIKVKYILIPYTVVIYWHV